MLDGPRIENKPGYDELLAFLARPAESRHPELQTDTPFDQCPERTTPPREGPERDFVRRLCALARRHRDLVRPLLMDIFAEDVADIITEIQEGKS
jgi:hypothetical protein